MHLVLEQSPTPTCQRLIAGLCRALVAAGHRISLLDPSVRSACWPASSWGGALFSKNRPRHPWFFCTTHFCTTKTALAPIYPGSAEVRQRELRQRGDYGALAQRIGAALAGLAAPGGRPNLSDQERLEGPESHCSRPSPRKDRPNTNTNIAKPG